MAKIAVSQKIKTPFENMKHSLRSNLYGLTEEERNELLELVIKYCQKIQEEPYQEPRRTTRHG